MNLKNRGLGILVQHKSMTFARDERDMSLRGIFSI
jgi:hypothetical protein